MPTTLAGTTAWHSLLVSPRVHRAVAYDVAGSGGYGSPANRDPESIREDIVNGYVSAEKASEEYGVDTSGMVCEHCVGTSTREP